MKITIAVLLAILILSTGCSSSNRESTAQLVQVEWTSQRWHFSTFDGLLIRPDRDTITFQFTHAEQKRIAYLADSVKFWTISDKILHPGFGSLKTPNSGLNTLRITTFDHDRTISWDDGAESIFDYPDGKARMLLNVIDSIIEMRPSAPQAHRPRYLLQ